MNKEGKKLIPIIAVQTAASSGAHLTKYSNVTDPVTGQKKLIIDEAIVPPRAVFDYKTTISNGAMMIKYTLAIHQDLKLKVLNFRIFI